MTLTIDLYFGGHREIITNTVEITGSGYSLMLLRNVVPSVAPVRASLGSSHQGFINRKLRHPIGHAGLVTEPSPAVPLYCPSVDAVPVDGVFQIGENGGAIGQYHGSPLFSAVGDSNFYSSFHFGAGNSKGQHLLNRYDVRVAGGNDVFCTAGPDDQATSFSYLQGVVFRMTRTSITNGTLRKLLDGRCSLSSTPPTST